MTFGSLASLRSEADRPDWTFAVFLAAADEDLVTFDYQSPGHQRFTFMPGFQTSDLPMRVLWGPGRLDDLIATVDRFSDEVPIDLVSFLDRIFYVRRTSDGAVEYPRDQSDVLSSGLADPSASWQLLRADYPSDALLAARGLFEVPDAKPVNATLIATLTGDAAAHEHAARST